MLLPRHLRDLSVDARSHPRCRAFLSAASGLVRIRGALYVVADDELHLGWIVESASAATPLHLLRLMEGDLPSDASGRKAAKPDLETLAALPPMPGFPNGALLALGSGSRPARETAVLLALDLQGNVEAQGVAVSLRPLYARLREHFSDVNIEGAFVNGGSFCVLQRGNKGSTRSACVRYDWNATAPWLLGQHIAPPKIEAIQPIDLGDVGGVPLGLTDGAALAGGAWAFCAVAEDTTDSYADGNCTGSAVGTVDANGRLRCLCPLAGAPKVEGVAVSAAQGGLLLTLVTDADDPHRASQLLEVLLPESLNGGCECL